MTMLSRLRRLAAHEKGNVLVLTALSLPLLLGCAGLGVDATQWFLWKRQLQQAADAGALAGVYSQADGFGAEAAVQDAVARNGPFPNLTTAIETPPATGPAAGQKAAVGVALAMSQRLPFSQLFLQAPPTIAVRAAATLAGQGPACVIALDENASSAVYATGNAEIDLGCGILSNSRANNAVDFSGAVSVTATPIMAVGGIYRGGAAVINSAKPLAPYSAPQVDPYGPQGRNLQVPTPSGSCIAANLGINQKESMTLQPGRYCGGMSFGGGTFALNPGTYFVDGGTFNAGSQARISGSGVTIILANGANLESNGGAAINLSAPTSGPLSGIVLAQTGQANIKQNRINGGADLKLSGVIYLPSGSIDFSGGTNGGTDCLQIVAMRIQFSGNSRIHNACSASSGVSPIEARIVRLVE